MHVKMHDVIAPRPGLFELILERPIGARPDDVNKRP